MSCCAYLPEAEDREVLATAYDIYSRQAQFPDAMRIALKMNDQARPRWWLDGSCMHRTSVESKGCMLSCGCGGC